MIIWFQVFFFNTNNFQIDLFDRVRIDQILMTVKGYSTLPRSPECLILNAV